MFSQTQIQILELLQTGQLISGNELAEKIGLSRTAIWKNIKQICDKGIAVQTFDKQGYQIEGGLDRYQASTITDALHAADVSIQCLDSVTSTNDTLSFEHPARWHLVIAEQQTSGRGRRGRHWSSPYAKHVYMSLGFYHRGPLEQLQGLSLVVALAVRNVLESMGVEQAQVKWPNDIWVNKQKIAGILIEMRGEANEGYQVIVGIGINVHREPELEQFNATAVNDHISTHKTELVIRLFAKLTEYIDTLRQSHFKDYVNSFNEHHVFHQQKVKLVGDDSQQIYQVQGIHHDGGIILQCNNESKIYYASEISMC